MHLIIRKFRGFWKLYNKDTNCLYAAKYRSRAEAGRKKKSMEDAVRRRYR
jgi:hypothetical protein